MCTSCLGTADFVATNVALLAGAVHAAVRAAEPADVRSARSVVRDAHTVAFLRDLHLDAAAVLGDAAVAAADDPVVVGRARAVLAARGQPVPLRARWRRPIGSQRRIALQ